MYVWKRSVGFLGRGEKDGGYISCRFWGRFLVRILGINQISWREFGGENYSFVVFLFVFVLKLGCLLRKDHSCSRRRVTLSGSSRYIVPRLLLAFTNYVRHILHSPNNGFVQFSILF